MYAWLILKLVKLGIWISNFFLWSLTTGHADYKSIVLLFLLRASDKNPFVAVFLEVVSLDLWDQHLMDLPCIHPVPQVLNHLSSWSGEGVKALRRHKLLLAGYKRNQKGSKSNYLIKARIWPGQGCCYMHGYKPAHLTGREDVYWYCNVLSFFSQMSSSIL